MTEVIEQIRNGVGTAQMFGTLDLLGEKPELAAFTFRARNRWIDGAHNQTTIQDFYAAGGEDTSREQAFAIDAGEPAILLGTDTVPGLEFQRRRAALVIGGVGADAACHLSQVLR
jgi:hypothetical protein